MLPPRPDTNLKRPRARRRPGARSLFRPLARLLPSLIGVMAALLLVLLLAGCPNAVRPGPQVTGAAAADHGVKSTANTAPVDLSVSPSPPKQLVPTTFTVTGHPAPGAGAVVTLTLTMPAMAMPPTLVRLSRDGGGVYRGTGAFTMPGDWQAVIAVTGAGKPSSKTVTLHVKE